MQNLSDETLTHRHSAKANAGARAPIRTVSSPARAPAAPANTGARSYRFAPEIFTLASELREKHPGAKATENVTAQDWGVTYDDLESNYWRAEQMLGRLGQKRQSARPEDRRRQCLRKRRASTNIPRRRTRLPKRRGKLFQKAAHEAGYHSLPAARRHPEPGLSKPRRHLSRRVRLLRLLHALLAA